MFRLAKITFILYICAHSFNVMYLKKLHIINYRNISQADISFCEGINCFVGQNGAGKTNLLDTIYYMSFCKSYFATVDTQNIRHNEPFFVIQGDYIRGDNELQIYSGVKRGSKKQFKCNKKEYPRLSEHIGLLPLVIVAPFDELLIAEGAEDRRKYIDGVISQCDKVYLDNLVRYNRLMQQRNALLKQLQDIEKPDFSVLDVYDIQMAQLGEIISQKRAQLIKWLAPYVSDIYQRLSSNKETIDINYITGLQRYDLYQGLIDARPRDLALGYTSRGIHKDDVEFLLGDYPMKRVGSQGQRKTFVIALKLAQYHYLYAHNGVKPILLLDDVFDKLDKQRGDNLISLVADDMFDQIFITDTNALHLSSVLEKTQKQYKIFEVDSGDVVETTLI